MKYNKLSLWIFVILVLSIILFFVNNHKHNIAYDNIVKMYEDRLLVEKNKRDIENNILYEKIDSLNEVIIREKRKIPSIKTKYIKIREELSLLSATANVEKLSITLGSNIDITKIGEDSVALLPLANLRCINEIVVERDYYNELSRELNSIILNQDSIIDNYRVLYSNSLCIIENLNELNNIKDKKIIKLEGIVNRESRRSKIDKILIGIAVLAGVIVAVR